MKAVGYKKSLPITEENSLVDIELEQPIATGRDLLVKIQAISVNPVDYKIRRNRKAPEGQYNILGWDAAGEVVATGEQAQKFKPGDMVYYAGDLTRPGSNAEYQLVDERLVAQKPKSLSNAEAAALPLTTITAWELLFDHLGLQKTSPDKKTNSDEIMLVVGAAGGVGSILVQLAKKITGATLIATASRSESKKWLQELKVDHVIDHSKPLWEQVQGLGLPNITHVASLNGTETYFQAYVDMLCPFGKIAFIDDPVSLDCMKMKSKSLSLHTEFMFARSMHKAKDMAEQGKLLEQVSHLIDRGEIRTTVTENPAPINAANLKKAHKKLEGGQVIGKIVLEGF